MSQTILGWQPALAPVLDQVVAAMDASHDALILRSGRARASGISWEIYGPELAGVLARTRAGGSAHGPQVSGSFEDGLDRITWHHAGSISGGPVTPAELAEALRSEEVRSDVVDCGGTAAMFRDYAINFDHPTIVIAYCQVRIRQGALR